MTVRVGFINALLLTYAIGLATTTALASLAGACGVTLIAWATMITVFWRQTRRT